MKPELSVVGIDLAKSLFHLVGMDERARSFYGSAWREAR